MTKNEFVDLLYCESENGNISESRNIIAVAPMSADVREGDIVRIDGESDLFFVSRAVTVMNGSDVYKFIVNAIDIPYRVTDKYSHHEIGGTENE